LGFFVVVWDRVSLLALNSWYFCLCLWILGLQLCITIPGLANCFDMTLRSLCKELSLSEGRAAMVLSLLAAGSDHV
jgi:hypothetical protein